MLDNTDHSAFPVMNNQNRPVGLIERDAIIAMIENKCWYFRESRLSGNFGTKERDELVGKVVEEHSAHLGVVKTEQSNRNNMKENKDVNDRKNTHASSINEDNFVPIDPNKREDTISFENNP